MRCVLCADKGVIRIGYQEAPREGYVDYGICSCAKGQKFRAPGFQRVLAQRFGVELEQVNLVEELLDPQDLPGFVAPAVDVTDAGRKSGRAKL